MAEDCTRSSRRLILLDYDGTLVPFAERLEKATPDNELLGILGGFAQEWFGSLDVGTGRRTRRMGQRGGRAWEIIEPLKNNWKKEIRPIWHYRKADPELGVMRARELKDALLHLIANLNLGVLDGNKVIEVKSAGIDKGRAVLCWISRREWDSVLAIGDDRTDEGGICCSS